jgi:hypothetical protein
MSEYQVIALDEVAEEPAQPGLERLDRLSSRGRESIEVE